jgi:hypothetical protein
MKKPTFLFFIFATFLETEAFGCRLHHQVEQRADFVLPQGPGRRQVLV